MITLEGKKVIGINSEMEYTIRRGSYGFSLLEGKGVDYLTGKGKSQKALIKQEVVEPQQVIAVSVKSSGCILEDGRGLVVAGT